MEKLHDEASGVQLSTPTSSRALKEVEATKPEVSTVRRLFPCVQAFRDLRRDYGLRLLIMISLCAHWCKGFGRFQLMNSLPYLLQSPWGITGPQMDIYITVCDLPWAMKPLLAIGSDMFPIFGYRKNPYILITAIFGISGILLSSFITPGVSTVEVPLAGLFLVNFAWMTCDVLVEGVYARRMAKNAGSGPDLVVFISVGQQLCCLLSSLVSGVVITHTDGLLELTGAQWNLALCFLPTAGVLIGGLCNCIDEKPMTCDEIRTNRKQILTDRKVIVWMSVLIGLGSLAFTMVGMFCRMDQSGHGVANLGFALAVLLLFNFLLWKYFPKVVSRLMIFLGVCAVSNLSVRGPAHYFYTDDVSQYPEGPHFSPWFYVSVCGIVGAVSGVLGALLFGMFKHIKYRTMYMVAILANVIISLPNSIIFARLNIQWGISDYVFVGSDTALNAAMTTMYFMPGMLLLTRICPDKIESSMFAILTSNLNFAQTTGSALCAFICSIMEIQPEGGLNESAQFDNMWIANLVLCGIKILPICLVFLIPNIRMTTELVV